MAAWATFGCPESGVPAPTIIHRRRADGTDDQVITTPLNTNQITRVAGILGTDIVYSVGFGGAAFLTDLRGAPRQIPDLGWVSSVDEVGGWVAGQLAELPEQGAVLNPVTGDYRWQVPDVYLGEFSPDGTKILGTGSDGVTLVFHAGDGTVLDRIDLPDGFESYETVWEDDSHLLLPVRQGPDQALVRADLGGNLTLASDVVPKDRPGQPRFVIAARP